MPAKVLDDDTVRPLVEAGLTNQEIVNALARGPYAVRVTAGAIANWRTSHGYKPQHRQRYSDLIPWTVARQHDRLYPAEMLRALGRAQRGELRPPAMAALKRWLDNRRDEQTVVWYQENDPSGKGWHYVDRHPLDDPKSVIRTPAVMDKIAELQNKQ